MGLQFGKDNQCHCSYSSSHVLKVTYSHHQLFFNSVNSVAIRSFLLESFRVILSMFMSKYQLICSASFLWRGRVIFHSSTPLIHFLTRSKSFCACCSVAPLQNPCDHKSLLGFKMHNIIETCFIYFQAHAVGAHVLTPPPKRRVENINHFIAEFCKPAHHFFIRGRSTLENHFLTKSAKYYPDSKEVSFS